MTVIDTPRRPAVRTLMESTSQWLDRRAARATGSPQTLAARESLLAQRWTRSSDQWTRSSDEDAVARETAR